MKIGFHDIHKCVLKIMKTRMNDNSLNEWEREITWYKKKKKKMSVTDINTPKKWIFMIVKSDRCPVPSVVIACFSAHATLQYMQLPPGDAAILLKHTNTLTPFSKARCVNVNFSREIYVAKFDRSWNQEENVI